MSKVVRIASLLLVTSIGAPNAFAAKPGRSTAAPRTLRRMAAAVVLGSAALGSVAHAQSPREDAIADALSPTTEIAGFHIASGTFDAPAQRTTMLPQASLPGAYKLPDGEDHPLFVAHVSNPLDAATKGAQQSVSLAAVTTPRGKLLKAVGDIANASIQDWARANPSVASHAVEKTVQVLTGHTNPIIQLSVDPKGGSIPDVDLKVTYTFGGPQE